LFVSYGSLKTDYNVRVGRSRSVLGPYVDFNGREMTDLTDAENEVGVLAFCGYKWNDGLAYMGPGHNSVLHDKDGSWYLVCHIREKNFYGTGEPSTMQIRKIFWTEEGWPLVSAEPYAGEVEQEIPREALLGRWERISLVNSLPQGIQTAVPMKIVDKDNFVNIGISTHSMSLSYFVKYLEKDNDIKIIFVGIEPETMEWGEMPTEVVQKGAVEFIDILKGIIL